VARKPTSPPGWSPRRYLGTDAIPAAANGFSGLNYNAFSEPAMDAAIVKVETEVDPKKLKEAWADIQRIYAEQVPELPLWFTVDPHVVPKWLKGYEPTSTYDFGASWAENWHAK
jgi:peptide/nickel transport system substrate-binding protein